MIYVISIIRGNRSRRCQLVLELLLLQPAGFVLPQWWEHSHILTRLLWVGNRTNDYDLQNQHPE